MRKALLSGVCLLWMVVVPAANGDTLFVGNLVPSTSGPAYAFGEPIQLIVTNPGPETVVFSNECYFESVFWIYNEQMELVNDPPQICLEYWDPIYIEPFESAMWSWEQLEPPGRYYFGVYGEPPFAEFDIVPEPATILALLCGLGGLVCRRRR